MKKLIRPNGLSDGAWLIIQAMCEHLSNDGDYTFRTSNLLNLNFSREDFEKYFQELHDDRFVFWEDRNTSREFLYILSPLYILYCGGKITLPIE